MIKREELLKSPEYWFETIQNELFRQLKDYIEKEGISQSELAEKLGVTKGYVSQVMNGNFNYTLKKLIELSLAIGKIPDLQFKDIESFIAKKENLLQMSTSIILSFETTNKFWLVNSNRSNKVDYTKYSNKSDQLKITERFSKYQEVLN